MCIQSAKNEHIMQIQKNQILIIFFGAGKQLCLIKIFKKFWSILYECMNKWIDWWLNKKMNERNWDPWSFSWSSSYFRNIFRFVNEIQEIRCSKNEEWINAWVNEKKNEETNEWMNEWINGQNK